STIAGAGTAGFSGDGGPANYARLNGPEDVAVDPTGNIFIADTMNGRVRKIDSRGLISTVAGIGSAAPKGDGSPAISATLYQPSAISFDTEGNLYISDYFTV